MPAVPSPTARGRRLRHELRRLREEAGLTHSEVARRLDWSASKLSRIETGQSRVQTGDVRDLLGAYGVTDEATAEALVQLAREARRRGWWTRYTDVLGSGTYVGLEADASALHTYESMFVPGLLQTEDYARAIIRADLAKPDPETLERRLAARMARQEILSRPDPPQIWAVLDESVVGRPVGGPAVMRAQLQYLIEVSNRPNTPLTLQVLPLTVGAHPGMNGPFVILEFQSPNDPPDGLPGDRHGRPVYRRARGCRTVYPDVPPPRRPSPRTRRVTHHDHRSSRTHGVISDRISLWEVRDGRSPPRPVHSRLAQEQS
jgi:transcriptional regulator with XRE-family HTH domain